LLAHQGITRSRKNPDRLPAEPDDAEPSRPEPTRSGVAVLLPSESRRDSHSRKESFRSKLAKRFCIYHGIKMACRL
jgi:hypothetical protein